jgi:hypothetical protein
MAEELRFPVEGAGEVSALLERPAGARWLYVFAHGAGAGMRHAFMEAMAAALAAEDVATFRYQFPYTEAGRRRPDRAPRLEATVRAAVRAAAEAAPDLPLFAGGKSMGGRMTSRAAAGAPLPGVLGLVFLGFPLHPAGKPGTERGDHLAEVALPMLFLQGTRDKLALPDLVRPVCAALPRVTLHEVDGADHGFHVLKRSGRTDDDVRVELAATVRKWLESLARRED